MSSDIWACSVKPPATETNHGSIIFLLNPFLDMGIFGPDIGRYFEVFRPAVDGVTSGAIL